MNEKNNAGKVIVILIIVILVLIGILAYIFLIRPAVTGYITQKQVEAKDVVLNSILLQLQQQGFVRITDQSGNSIVLAPVQQNQPAQ